MAIGKVNTGGGGSGGTLVVTGVAGDTITATKGGKTYSRTFNSAGKAVFRGLATGIWALTMTNGSQTVTRNVTITADYSLTMAYFSATVTVTYPANSTCTCSDGTTTLTDTNTGATEKTVAFTVHNTGTWTVTATDGDKTKSASVSITTEGQAASVTLTYELYLLQNGVQKTEFKTGVYEGTVTFESSAVKMEGNTTNLCTSSKIDVSAYSSLKFTYSGGYSLTFGVRITDPADHFWNGPDLASVHASNASSPTTETVDISNINQAVYVQIQSLNNTAYIYSIWLE